MALSVSDQPRILVVDTSGRRGIVAVAEGDQLLAERLLDERRRHAGDLAPAVASLLQERVWRPKDVDAVIVSRGPGSYTGLRVGIMFAKTWAYSMSCRLISVETFAAVALRAPAANGHVEVIADAQQGKIYVQQFRRENPDDVPSAMTSLTVMPLSEWLGQRDMSFMVTGPGLRAYAAALPEDVQLVDSTFWDPAPAAILKTGIRRLLAGDHDDLWGLEPLYHRPSSAEEKLRVGPRHQ